VKRYWYLLSILIFVLVSLSACAPQTAREAASHSSLLTNVIHIAQTPDPTPLITQVERQNPKPTSTVSALPPVPTAIPSTGAGTAPYGPPPPITAEEIQLTQQLFALINSDRAKLGLYPFAWNNTLAGGARLHSWNMIHCGFSHTCPNGENQCQRIADEGFAGYTDCGENIGEAGPYPTPWGGVYNIQESMMNEPPTGWHRIHLTSTTLHRIGIGIVIDANGWIWFTEDMVS
jgi:uncharacterized protein YkwD